MGDINQDDIDKLLNEALSADDSTGSAHGGGGPASQDDIDALFAAVGGESEPEPAAPAPEPADHGKADAAASDLEGTADQDDIDALFSAIGGAAEPEPEKNAPKTEPRSEAIPEQPAAEPESAAEHDETAGPDDIDALFSAVAAEPDDAEAELPQIPEPADHGDDAPAADKTRAIEDTDLDALLSSIADDVAAPPAAADGGKNETVKVDTVDMDELLKEITQAAPPPPPPPAAMKPPHAAPDADTTVLDMTSQDISQALAAAAAPPPSPVSPVVSLPPPAQPPGQKREFSVLYGAGEVESVANQISTLIASLSEKAHRYMQGWMTSESELKELRNRLLTEERRRTTVTGERDSLTRELDELRQRLAEVEGAKVALEEARRTRDTAHQARVRELESRLSLASAEAESLKDELTRARNEATGVDIESRRARFEADRLKNEVESERMERLRMQRALENREKELQAVQAQAGGQASSLFLDELHRLVRRLESELESRTAGANEALKQLDRLDTAEAMVPVVSNLRASLMQAAGVDDSHDDALKSLGREASGIRGGHALAAEKTDMSSFETAIATFNLNAAVDAAGTLLREAKTTPGLLMKKVYQCPALRRPEIVERLPDLARLLEGLRTIQEAGDRSRGKETAESEVFYVQMFDFLHNLVRLKIINRLSGDIWRLFLDLRGRFSFVTSDKQWAEYRDSALSDRRG